MNLVLANLLKTFRETYEIDTSISEEKSFEYFVNCLIAQSVSPAKIDPVAITTADDDAGIDGVIISLDGEIVTSIDEADEVFKRQKFQFDAEVILTQVKTSESFSKGEITNFTDGVFDFFSQNPKLPQGKWLADTRSLVFLLFSKAAKLKNGRPSLSLYYATTGQYRKELELEAAFQIAKEKIDQHGLFSTINPCPLDRNELIQRSSKFKTDVIAELPVIGAAAYPIVEGIGEAYVAVVRAIDFVDRLLVDPDGTPRPFIFEENVRDFLGGDNDVNSQMQSALSDAKTRLRFGIMNNGVTIISPDVSNRGTTFTLKSFQIVNGCQTSNTLLEQRSSLTPAVVITAKIVEATDPDVIAGIVKATNNQTRVDESAFLSLSPVARRAEQYFQARPSHSASEPQLFLERRQGQFRLSEVTQSRVVMLKDLFRSVAAFWFDRPDLAARYPADISKEIPILLEATNREIVYYTSAMALYKVGLLIGARKIPHDFHKARWHLLMCFKYYAVKDDPPNINQKRADKYCEDILNKLSDENGFAYFEQAVARMKMNGSYERDTIRTRSYIETLKSAAKAAPILQ
jgi:AIPR protein